MFFYCAITLFKEKEMSRSIVAYETKREAEVTYHKKIAANMADESVQEHLITVLTSVGDQLMTHHYVAEESE